MSDISSDCVMVPLVTSFEMFTNKLLYCILVVVFSLLLGIFQDKNSISVEKIADLNFLICFSNINAKR